MKWTNKLLPVCSLLNIVAATIAGILEKEVQSYIFIGLALLFGLIWVIIRGFKHFRSNPESENETTNHRNLEYRKTRFDVDCRTEDNGKANGSLCLMSRRSILSYNDSALTQIGHRKEFTVTALFNGVREFTDRYQYSADNFEKSEKGICKLHTPERGQHITSIQRVDGFVFYTIHIDQGIRKGKPKKLVMDMEPISDIQRRMQTFLSTGIYEPTKKLELILNYPPQANLKDPVIRVYNNYAADIEIDALYPNQEDNQEDNQFIWDSEHGQLKYTIDYPIYGYKYKMEWYFD